MKGNAMVHHTCGVRLSRGRSAIATLAALCVAAPACATGFFVDQQSVKGIGRAGAGNVTAADELGTLFFNPAGLTHLWRNGEMQPRVSVGVQLIVPRGSIRDSGSSATTLGSGLVAAPITGPNSSNPTDPTPIPNIYWAMPLDQGRSALGLAINFPFGLATKFKPDWYGRYDATEASLRTVNLGLVAAHRFGEQGLSVGFGIDLQYANSTLATALPDPLNPGGPTAATDGRTETSGHAWSPGFNMGVLLPVGPNTRVGAHYRSGITHHLQGATVVQGLTGPLAAFNGSLPSRADLRLPAVASLGVRHALIPDRLFLMGQLEWYDWSRFKEIRVRFASGAADAVRPAGYRDAIALALGAEYSVSRDLMLRAGLRFDQTPTVDGLRDTTVPDADRLWLALGATIRRSNNATVDLAFTHAMFRRSTVALTRNFYEGSALATAVRIHGRAHSVVDTIAIEGRWTF